METYDTIAEENEKGTDTTMSDNNTTVNKQDILEALRNPGELYVIISNATRQPFIHCDEESFDDQVFLYFRSEDAENQIACLSEGKYAVAVARIEEKQLLPFYTSLFTIGVNCLGVNYGTAMQISIQLSDLVKRKLPEDFPDGQKIVENPALHLTAAYFMQEMRRLESPGVSEQLKELQEEMLAHYRKGTFLMAVQEDGQVPMLKQKDGSVYQPVFTDMLEVQRFSQGKPIKTVVVTAAQIPGILAESAKGVVINPFGVNVQLHIQRQNQSEADS